MEKFKKILMVLFVILMLSPFSMQAFADNETNDGNIKIEVETNKDSYSATGVAEITATITNVSSVDIEGVIAQAVFDDLAPAGKRKSETSKSVDVLKSGESFSFRYKATLDADEHGLNIFQKIILWFVRLFNGGYNADNDSINVVTECVTEIEFGKFTAENVIQVGYEKIVTETWDYSVDDSHVVITDEDGNGYVNNRIIILFTTDDKERINSIINEINGKIVGSSGGTYQVEVPEMSLEALKELCKNIGKIDGVWNAMCDITFQAEIDENTQELDCLSSVPNDPWKDTFQGIMGVDWDESNPDGYNWWLETIEAPSAWDYNERFSNIKIGVVDNGFDTNHEDLKITVLNNDKNSIEDHGTHVAGIIGATANNNTGITGLVWNKELFGVDVFKTKEQKKQNISVHSTYQGIELALKNNCKTVNMSIGKSLKNNFDIIYEDGYFAATYILYWKEKFNRDDFIIIQAAGNDKVNSIRNGFFCSITDEVLARYYDEYKEKLEDYTIEQIYDVYDHFIVVGGVEKESSGYILFSYGNDGSNYGEQISISAPGEDIFSTVASGGLNGSYGNLPGTSMAAPIVTGVASLVWSINPNFSAKEVKDIVCNYTNKTAKTNKFSVADTRTYPIVNAKLAVEEAIRRTDNSSGGNSGNTETNTTTVTGTVTDSTTGNTISGVTVNIADKDGNVTMTTTTDENGKFSINLPTGDHQIVFLCDGYTVFGQLETIEDTSKNIDLGEILLEPASRTITASGNCGADGDNVTWVLYDDGELVISGSGDMKDYSNLIYNPMPWREHTNSIEAVKITEGVTRIGDYAFHDLSNKLLIISDTVKTIGCKAFSGCSLLKNVELSNGLISIDNGAFENCAIKEISIPDSVINIGESAFQDCSNLEKVKMGQGVETLGTRAFAYCTHLKEINLSNSLTRIEGAAFINCPSLISLSIPDNVTDILSNTFSHCSNLKSVILPTSLKSIGHSAFYDCTSLTSIIIPDGVTTIEAKAFYNCINLSFETMPNSVTSIGNYAFAYCKSLLDFTIPNSVKDIGEGAFYNCANINEFIIPYNVTNIGYLAFGYCTNLKRILVDKANINYFSDDYGVLYNKDKTTILQFPAGNEIEEYAIIDGVTSISDYTFCGCIGLTEIKIPNSVTSIGKGAFSSCINLSGITLPNGITHIQESTFNNSGITKITIPNTVTSISRGAFNNCSNLKSVMLPSSITFIDSFAFSGCTDLMDVYYGGNSADWGKISINSTSSRIFPDSTTIHYNS